MNNTDYPIGSDTQEAPWNEKESKTKEVEIVLFLEKKVKVLLKVNEDDEVYKDETTVIDSVGDYTAQSLNIDYIDWDFVDNIKFEK